MNQKITIIIDGLDGVLPDSVGNILRAIFDLLDSLDRQSWKVDAPRIAWRVSEAKLVNPLTLIATGVDLHPSDELHDVALRLVECLEKIETGIRPPSFGDRELKLAKMLGREARRSHSVVISGENGKVKTHSISRSFFRRANKLMKRPREVTNEYGSLDGTLVQLANDPLKTAGTAKLRERIEGVDVACYADPDIASELAKYVNRKSRLILYGTIRREDGVPVRIEVESFSEIPPENELPTLDDLHALRLRLPNDMEVEDFLDDLRGDG